MSMFFCECKKPEFHENVSTMSSWKPGELIRLFDFSVWPEMRTFLKNLGCTSDLFQEVKQGSPVNSEDKKETTKF